MKRSTAICAAKEAYRHWLYRGLLAPGFHVSSKGDGYIVVFPEWVVYLKENGNLHHTSKRN